MSGNLGKCASYVKLQAAFMLQTYKG